MNEFVHKAGGYVPHFDHTPQLELLIHTALATLEQLRLNPAINSKSEWTRLSNHEQKYAITALEAARGDTTLHTHAYRYMGPY